MTETSKKITWLGVFIWAIASFYYLYEFFLRTFLGTIADQIMRDLHLSVEQFTLLGTAYYILYGLLQIPVGLIVDRFGSRAILSLSCFICTAGIAIFAVAHGFYLAFLARMLMGFGSSFAFVCLLVLALNWFPQSRFGFFSGLSQFLGAMGPMLAGGPLVWLLKDFHGNWRAVVWLFFLSGALLAITLALFIRNEPKNHTKQYILDYKYALRVQLKKLFQNSQVWAIGIYSCFGYVTLALLGAIWGTDYLEAKGMTQEHAAFIASLIWFGLAVGCPVAGWFSDKIARRKLPMLLCTVAGVLASAGIVFVPGNNPFFFGSCFLLLGLSGAGQSIAFAAISEHIEQAFRATALGFNNASMMIGGAIIPILVAAFIHQPAKGQHFVPQDFHLGFLLLPVMYTLSLLICQFGIKESFCRAQRDVTVLVR